MPSGIVGISLKQDWGEVGNVAAQIQGLQVRTAVHRQDG